MTTILILLSILAFMICCGAVFLVGWEKGWNDARKFIKEMENGGSYKVKS